MEVEWDSFFAERMMGVYYKVVCDEHKETLDPGGIDNNGNKQDSICSPGHPIGPLVMFTILTRWFSPIRIVCDEEEEYYSKEYSDITTEAWNAYRSYYGIGKILDSLSSQREQ